MKASIAHGVRPSVLVLGKDSRKTQWTPTDILLAKAYQRFLNELCKQCGLPRYICHTDDNRIQFKSVKDECASAAVADKAVEAMGDKKTYGTRMMGEPYLVDAAVDEGLEFSDFRRPYLINEAKKHGWIPEESPQFPET